MIELRAGDYWVVETKSPVGYRLDSTPKKVTVAAPERKPYLLETQRPNAVFEIYGSEIDAKTHTRQVIWQGAETFVADAQGAISSEYLSGAEYWLVRDIAPGEVADTTPFKVVPIAPLQAMARERPARLEVANEQFASWVLPLTGGVGQTIYLAGGTMLFGTAISFALLRRRRREALVEAAAPGRHRR